jgi:hypothetical protein
MSEAEAGETRHVHAHTHTHTLLLLHPRICSTHHTSRAQRITSPGCRSHGCDLAALKKWFGAIIDVYIVLFY